MRLLVKVARTKGDDQIARLGICIKVSADLFKCGKVNRLCAARIDARNHVPCMHAAIVRFAAGIDVRHKHFIRRGKTGHVFAEERFARV